MPNHLSALGFPVTTEQDFRHYVYQATEFGEKIESEHGSYTLWSPGNGIELWVQANLHRRIIGMNPHFSGQARMNVGLIQHIAKYSILDGAFYGWADPYWDNPETGQYAFSFDVPNYDIYSSLQLPVTMSVQLAAFAFELQGYEREEDYRKARGEKAYYPVKSFIRSGFFIPSKGPKVPTPSQAIVSGRVLAAELITNTVTNQKFYWAKIETLGGEMDVVADPQVVQGKVIAGGIVKGEFWLSGRLPE